MKGRRGVLALVVAMAGLVTSTATVEAASTSTHSDLAAFGQLRLQQEDAWARGDAAAFAATFTRDGDMVTFNGDHLHGRDHITSRMQHYLDTYLEGTRLLMLTERLRYVEPDVAVIVRTGCVLWDDQTTCTEEALSVNTNVFVKRHGKWLQSSFQNTRIRPIP
jgi:uncharacterized protein (TIGR02246 family)